MAETPPPVSPRPSPAPSPAPSAGGAGLAWLLFAPLALLEGLRRVLAWSAERVPLPPAWRLQPFAGQLDPFAWIGQLGWALGALLLLGLLGWWLRRRWGTRVLLRWLAALWLLGCVAAGLGLALRQINLRSLQPMPEVPAQVLGSHFKEPNLRSLGGTLLVLRIADEPVLQQVLVSDAAAAQLQPGQQIKLLTSVGRAYGRFLTGWLPAAPAGAPSTPTPAPTEGS